MELIKLIGVLIVVLGFIFKVDTIATVVVAGVVTGLVANQTPMEILEILGKAFVDNRFATLFVLTIPAVALLERYGLKEKAVDFISRFKNATTGSILSLYLVIRSLSAAFSMRIGGHATFIRPLISPMAQAATQARYGEVPEDIIDDIKGQSGAVENYGNFYAQNVFMGAAGTLLIVSTLNEQGFKEVNAQNIAEWSIPIAVIAVFVGGFFFWLHDQKIKQRLSQQSSASHQREGSEDE
ncbi:DUF969 domain-containing protein [Ignavigranum ruoffiae]|uniref:Uncharacterized membrane protein n=1 Tax=Ignavigranum ruoffiae TaxID=89093 RepID=A0A1H9BKS2_9LACT|nr:DUF969 domain-containing protein [Ignavigranum ruoffiae]SEP88928.1 Uncharacterized membrane protein [Ignavigranum ruoffiae]